MTPAVLSLVESVERADAEATPGPWLLEEQSGSVLSEESDDSPSELICDCYTPGVGDVDATLIALYRTAAPALAATVREMAEKLAAMLATHARDTKARLDAEAEVARLRTALESSISGLETAEREEQGGSLAPYYRTKVFLARAALSPEPKETNR